MGQWNVHSDKKLLSIVCHDPMSVKISMWASKGDTMGLKELWNYN